MTAVGMTQSKTPPIRRQFPFAEFKLLDEHAGTFSGYLAVYGNEDQGADIIDQGASAKTLGDARAVQTKRIATGAPSGRYLWPIFWGHDDQNPVGGFTSAREDSHGLWVEAELDMDIEAGRRAYSGLKKGYAAGLSIGYFVTKATFDREGRRHLKEIAIFEGSITPIPMNQDAIVAEVKTATGKSSWPLGDRNAAWDDGAAHKRIVAWATVASGDADPDKLKSVHFYSPTGDAVNNVSAYKLLFCDVVGGVVTAMPRGIMACAGSHGVTATAGISAGEQETIKNKIGAYYKRMAAEFDDDTIVAPWDQEDSQKDSGKSSMGMKNGRRQPQQPQQPRQKAMDFTAALASVSADDSLQDEWGDANQALVNSLQSIMIQACWLASTDGDSFDPQAEAEAALAQFGAYMGDLVKRSLAANFVPALDDDCDSFLDPDGPNAGDDDDDDASDSAGWMSADLTGAQRKAGRIMSAANHTALGGMIADMKKSLTALGATHKAMTAFHAKVDPSAAKPDAASQDDGGDTTSADGGKNQGGKALDTRDTRDSDTARTGAGAHGNDPAGATTPLTADDMTRMIRERMRQRRDAAHLAAAIAN